MTARRYIDLMSERTVVLNHGRPRVSNDNAVSEAQFKTQKYHPDYLGRFEHAADARTWCEAYFERYNFEHHHAGLAGYTPEQVFTGRHREAVRTKQFALEARYAQNPERFVAGPPSKAIRVYRITPGGLPDRQALMLVKNVARWVDNRNRAFNQMIVP